MDQSNKCSLANLYGLLNVRCASFQKSKVLTFSVFVYRYKTNRQPLLLSYNS